MAGTRASLSITTPNEQWIQEQIDSGEFTSRSEVVNDLIRKAREVELIRAKLIAAEMSIEQNGYSKLSPEEILKTSKDQLKRNGEL